MLFEADIVLILITARYTTMKEISVRVNIIRTWIDTEPRPYCDELSVDWFVERDLLGHYSRVVN